MSVYVIPVSSTTDAFTQQVELDEVAYDLTFRWNARDAHWFLSISLNGTEIVSGIKLVISTDLLQYARRIDDLPTGKLMIVDLDNQDRDPDSVLFGDRVVLMYDDG